MMRLAAADMLALDALDTGERGIVINTASIAAFEGQIGQAGYAASKGGVASMTLPAAREFASKGGSGSGHRARYFWHADAVWSAR